MTHFDEEPDYLAGTQLPDDPSSFVRVVKEAFLLEHEALLSQDIAEIMGVDKSRMSQIFGNPKNLKPESIQNLLDHLQSREHKRRIVRAWANECFGEDIDVRPKAELTGRRISEKTLRRVDRQIRESRLDLAAQTASEAAKKTDNPVLREQFLDRAYFVRQRLDEPGKAMQVVRIVASYAERSGDVRRMASAQLRRARILVGMADSKPGEVEPIFQLVEALLETADPLPSSPRFHLATTDMLAATRLGAHLNFIDRGLCDIDAENLRFERGNCAARAQNKKLPFQTRFAANILAARISLILGETFQASEYLDLAFQNGEIKNLNALETCGVLKARILAQTDPAKVSDYLLGVSNGCGKSLDLYHKRLAEYDLARVESGKFPGPT